MQNDYKRTPYYSMAKEDFLASGLNHGNAYRKAPNDKAFVMGMSSDKRSDGTISRGVTLGEVFDQIFTTNQYKIVKKLRNSTAEYAQGLNIGDVIEFHIYLAEGRRHPHIDMIKNGEISKTIYNNEIHKLFNEDNPIYQIQRI